jgi:hypothetical protein
VKLQPVLPLYIKTNASNYSNVGNNIINYGTLEGVKGITKLTYTAETPNMKELGNNSGWTADAKVTIAVKVYKTHKLSRCVYYGFAGADRDDSATVTSFT